MAIRGRACLGIMRNNAARMRHAREATNADIMRELREMRTLGEQLLRRPAPDERYAQILVSLAPRSGSLICRLTCKR